MSIWDFLGSHRVRGWAAPFSFEEFTAFVIFILRVTCCKSCNFMSKMENLNPNCFWSWIQIPWHITLLDICFRGWLQSIPFPVLVRTAEQQSHLWSLLGQGTQNSSWMSSSYWQTLGQEGVLSEHPRTQFLLLDNHFVFHWSEVPTSQKNYLILLFSTIYNIILILFKPSNNSSFMLKVTGKHFFLHPFKKAPTECIMKELWGLRKQQPYQNFQEASAFLYRHLSLEASFPPFCFLQHQFALHYKAQQYLHELCIYLSSLGL